MKVFLLLGCILLSACAGLSQQWQNAIAFGSIQELNELSSDVDKQLLLRLYRSPSKTENCFKETHGVCQYDYFLSVSSFDETPQTNTYKLKIKGEIVRIDWQNESKNDSAKINVTFNKYTKTALNNNKSLEAEKNTIRVEVGLNHILELDPAPLR